MSEEYSHWSIDHIVETGIVDKIDAKIIDQLYMESRQTTQSIADKVGIKRTTAHERIKKLSDREIIDSFTCKLNLTKCGLPLRAFILVGYDTSKEREGSSQKVVAKLLSRLKYVISVDIITGSTDFLVRVASDYMDTLSDIIIEQIRQIPGVGNTQSLISFQEYRNGRLITRKRK
ncbi:MAG: Lrp/AsnC family transcriptional regulator [Candidatus Kariarchaeaceae archaeon]|jgi:Lrp/AsnC family leucine-responsive transcriptional regulator